MNTSKHNEKTSIIQNIVTCNVFLIAALKCTGGANNLILIVF